MNLEKIKSLKDLMPGDEVGYEVDMLTYKSAEPDYSAAKVVSQVITRTPSKGFIVTLDGKHIPDKELFNEEPPNRYYKLDNPLFDDSVEQKKFYRLNDNNCFPTIFRVSEYNIKVVCEEIDSSRGYRYSLNKYFQLSIPYPDFENNDILWAHATAIVTWSAVERTTRIKISNARYKHILLDY